MVKTRSQTGNIAIKEEEEDCKPSLLLNSASNTTSNRITKRKPTIHRNDLPAQQVKAEEHSDTKPLLKSTPKSSKSGKTQKISQEQINQLIDYIVNDNMKVNKASLKVNIHHGTATYYYNVYKNDPEKRIPVPRGNTTIIYTQSQIENLIKYVDGDKMTMKEAAAKANMTYRSAYHYYHRYLKDPNYNIPIPQFQQNYTQDQKNEFIDYVINDKMSIAAASKKAKLNLGAAQRYYRKYFKVQNPDIARPSHIVIPKCYAQEQIKEVISYIVDDKMSIQAASKKANIGQNTARRHYRQYLKDNNIEHPVPKRTKVLTQDEINQFFGDVVDDEMTTREASKKVNTYTDTGIKYYRQYLKDRHIDYSIRKLITQEQKSELIRYIVDDKMSITAASKKANMGFTSGYKYYQQYLKGQKHNIPL